MVPPCVVTEVDSVTNFVPSMKRRTVVVVSVLHHPPAPVRCTPTESQLRNRLSGLVLGVSLEQALSPRSATPRSVKICFSFISTVVLKCDLERARVNKSGPSVLITV